MLKSASVTLAAALLATSAHAQAVSVVVSTTGSDAVGVRLATRIRETFARSPLFKLVFSEEEAALKVSVVTLEPGTSNGNMTVYAEVITIPNAKGLDSYLTSAVGTCGVNKIDSCADSIKADADAQVTLIRQALSNK